MDPTPADHGSHAPGGSHRHAGVDDELVADDLDLTPTRDEIDVPVVTAEDLADRSELATYLLPHVFPATPGELVDTALGQGAPDDMLARLAELPSRSYQTVQEVWTALGGPTEPRRSVEPGDTAAPEEALRDAFEQAFEQAFEEAPYDPSEREPAPLGAPVSAVPGWVDHLATCAGQWTEQTVRAVLGGSIVATTSVARKLWPWH